MIKSTYNYWKDILDKIIPVKIQGYIFLVAFVFIITATYLTTIKNNELNKEFYTIGFNDRINDSSRKSDGIHYKIGANWYLVKHKIVNQMIIGDSIYKEPNSLHLIIKNSNRIKWDRDVNQSIIFKKDLTPKRK